MNSITTEGDKYDRKGSLTGGYHDIRNSRLDAVKNLKEWQEKSERAERAFERGKAAIVVIDQEITQFVGQLEVARGAIGRLTEGRTVTVERLREAQQEQDRIKGRVVKLGTTIATSESAIQNQQVELNALEEELKTKMEQSLSDAELLKIEELNAETDQTKGELLVLSNETATVSPR